MRVTRKPWVNWWLIVQPSLRQQSGIHRCFYFMYDVARFRHCCVFLAIKRNLFPTWIEQFSLVKPKPITIHLHVFSCNSRRLTCIYYEFWLVHWTVLVWCDQPEWWVWFWFHNTQCCFYTRNFKVNYLTTSNIVMLPVH